MTYIISKKGSERRSDPKIPESFPDHDRAVEHAKKFMARDDVSAAEKKDAMRIFNNNPNNLPGLPDYYGKRSLKSFIDFGGKLAMEEHEPYSGEGLLPCLHEWTRKTISVDNVTTYSCPNGHVYQLKQEVHNDKG